MNIHPTAIVFPGAQISEDVSIGAFSIIYDDVVIESGTRVEAYCELGVSNSFTDGAPLHIGKNSLIRSHSIFYAASNFGDGLVTGHRVTVRENTDAGLNLQIGTLCDIQGHCEIGDYVRLHSNVHIGQKSRIGNFVWIFPYAVLTNDPHPPSHISTGVLIEDFAVIATMSVVLPGAHISTGCLIAAHSSIKGETDPDYVYAGSPAKKICPTSRIKLSDGSGSAYPWRKHFTRGYPEHVVDKWSQDS